MISHNKPTESQLSAFAAALDARGMPPREYASTFEGLYQFAGTLWRHMCDMDTRNLKGWEGSIPLANAWAEGNACVEPFADNCRGNRRFTEDKP